MNARALSLLALVAIGTASLPASPSPAQAIDEKALLCAGCHGENGVPQQTKAPVIWGQHQGYTYLQLRDYKSGARKNEIMSPLAQSLERDEMLALALYFERKRWPDLQQAPASSAAAARALVCTGCHQANYLGEGTQPRIAGQTKEYLLRSMLDFRSRARANNPGMSDLMLAISEDDIAACAEYLAGLR
jgi:cytochrome c553